MTIGYCGGVTELLCYFVTAAEPMIRCLALCVWIAASGRISSRRASRHAVVKTPRNDYHFYLLQGTLHNANGEPTGHCRAFAYKQHCE